MASLKGSKLAPKNPNLGDDGRASARKLATDKATAATTGDAGLAQGQKAKGQVAGDDGADS